MDQAILQRKVKLTTTATIADVEYAKRNGFKHSQIYAIGVRSLKEGNSVQKKLLELEEDNNKLVKRLRELAIRLSKFDDSFIQGVVSS